MPSADSNSCGRRNSQLPMDFGGVFSWESVPHGQGFALVLGPSRKGLPLYE